ncbi:type II toxin-antitoxin system VapC family toxin [Candidatus Amesbacteria bacterium]|nr:type II toxin-antitoxin system VapC family toxin [Candidatus Amesbacteria bacterium]
MKKILVDTNALRKVSEDYEPILEKFNDSDVILLSPIVIGELIYGYKKGNREAKNKKFLESFIEENNIEVLKISQETAEIYANFRYQLGKKGKPIPSNDIWIAAQAMENGAVLVTYDQHFSEIPGLRVWGE